LARRTPSPAKKSLLAWFLVGEKEEREKTGQPNTLVPASRGDFPGIQSLVFTLYFVGGAASSIHYYVLLLFWAI